MKYYKKSFFWISHMDGDEVFSFTVWKTHPAHMFHNQLLAAPRGIYLVFRTKLALCVMYALAMDTLAEL